MQSVGIPRGTNAHLIATKVRRRTWLLRASAVTVGLIVLALGVRELAQRVRSQDTASLTAIGITPVAPPIPASNFHFADGAGRPLSLVDFKGHAVVLNLWATWCVPCREEMPSLDGLQAKLGGTRFQVLAISIDRQGAAVVRPFYRKLELRSLEIYLDPSGKAPSVFDISGVPATLLIDAQGREIGRKLGALAWDSPSVIETLRQVFELTEPTKQVSVAQKERTSP